MTPIFFKINSLALAINDSEILIMGGCGISRAIAIYDTKEDKVRQHHLSVFEEGSSRDDYGFDCHGNQCQLSSDKKTIYALILDEGSQLLMISYQLKDDFVRVVKRF